VTSLIDRYWFAPAPAARLGVVRALVGVFAAGYVIGRLPHSLSYAHFQSAQFAPVGIVRWLLDAPLPALVVQLLAIATALASIPFMLGWRFRITGPVFAALLTWTLSYNNSWGMIFHTENLMLLHVIILAVAPAAAAWSLDARRVGAPTEPDGRYGWALKLMAWVVVIAYVLAGVAKVRNAGMGWVWGDDLRNYIAMDNMRKLLLGDSYSPIAASLLGYATVFKVLALATLALELGAPLALLSRKVAAAWAICIVGFHASVVLLMWIVFPYPLLGVAFLPFFHAEHLGTWLERRWAGVTLRGRTCP
jgi:hypothetical protein